MSPSPLKVCYVLSDSGEDFHADVNLLSIWSLRRHNPKIQIVLLCDTQTAKTLYQKSHQILQFVDKLIPVATPRGSEGFRNRFLKTTMCRHINGSFLYLDADTLIRGDLTPIFSLCTSFAAVPNHNGYGEATSMPHSELRSFHQLGWQIPQRYVNGGVLYFSGHPSVHAFFELWHQKWLAFNARTRKHNDQPSLNSALNDSDLDFAWLEHCYNAQVHARPHTAWGAVVWHIYLSDHHASPKTIFDLALTHSTRTEFNRDKILDSLEKRDHPWLIDNPIDRLAVKFIRHRKQILGPTSWQRLWLADDYTGALKSIIRTIKNRAGRHGTVWKSSI